MQEWYKSLHSPGRTSQYLVMPTAGAIFTLWVLDKEDTHNERN